MLDLSCFLVDEISLPKGVMFFTELVGKTLKIFFVHPPMFQMIFSFCSSSDGNCLPEVYWGVINFIFFSNFKLFSLYWGQFSSVAQSCPTLCDPMNPWIAAHQASLSITNSQSSPKPMSIESVMPSNHLILCRPLLLLPSIFPSIRVFSNESALWPKYWSFSISPSNDGWLIGFLGGASGKEPTCQCK